MCTVGDQLAYDTQVIVLGLVYASLHVYQMRHDLISNDLIDIRQECN